MKKLILAAIVILFTSSLSAQFETNLKLGSSVNTSGYSFGGKAGFYLQGGFGYRFLSAKRVSIISSLFIDKSAYTMDDLTFGGLLCTNCSTPFETSSLSYQLYAIGINVGSEIIILNPNKKTNFYITPNLGYRRVFSVTQESSNPNLEVSKHPDINQGFIIDWGIELGVKLQKFKFGVSLRDVLNKNNEGTSSFLLTNAFTFSASYLFGGKKSKKETE